jgi:hypothetical protein
VKLRGDLGDDFQAQQHRQDKNRNCQRQRHSLALALS